MFNKTLLLLPILAMAAVPVLADQSSKDTEIAAGVVMAALAPTDSSDESTSSETVIREAWPKVGFYDRQFPAP